MDAFRLPTRQLWVRISILPIFFSVMLCDVPLVQWTRRWNPKIIIYCPKCIFYVCYCWKDVYLFHWNLLRLKDFAKIYWLVKYLLGIYLCSWKIIEQYNFVYHFSLLLNYRAWFWLKRFWIMRRFQSGFWILWHLDQLSSGPDWLKFETWLLKLLLICLMDMIASI